MSLIRAILGCICGDEPTTDSRADEKQALLAHQPRTAEAVAEQVVQTLVSAEKAGPALQRQLDNIVGECGWTEWVAKWVLDKLEAALREVETLGPVLKDAYDRACEAAKATEGFVMEHPVICTVIALGVLVIIAPWVLEALGFAELGPVEGSFAAAWQARYAGYVPKGSLFSFFQRLGMKWHY